MRTRRRRRGLAVALHGRSEGRPALVLRGGGEKPPEAPGSPSSRETLLERDPGSRESGSFASSRIASSSSNMSAWDLSWKTSDAAYVPRNTPRRTARGPARSRCFPSRCPPPRRRGSARARTPRAMSPTWTLAAWAWNVWCFRRARRRAGGLEHDISSRRCFRAAELPTRRRFCRMAQTETMSSVRLPKEAFSRPPRPGSCGRRSPR